MEERSSSLAAWTCRTILDGENILCNTATGDGKSAVFGIPLVVLLEMALNPTLYPDLPYHAKPIGIVVTPTKGLAANIVRVWTQRLLEHLPLHQVLEVAALGIKALAYSSDTVTRARKIRTKLHLNIAESKWNLICVDTEHLTAKDWRLIKDSSNFRDNLSLLCVDEIHLINQWGVEFRQAFDHIGRFARGCLPASTSIIGLSVTLQPGPDTLSVCTSMGFIARNYFHLQRSNEQPNIQFILEKLSHGLGGDKFPDLLLYLVSNRKTVIYCFTIDMCWRVAIYLWHLLPPRSDKMARVRLYHALCWSEENEETTRLLRGDPRTQIVIATIAFGQGINVKTLLNSIQLSFPVSLDQEQQQRGRACRTGTNGGSCMDQFWIQFIKISWLVISQLVSGKAVGSFMSYFIT